ncbi:MAG: hypothetical protein GX032_03555 [Tenericutes bacterium]|jgi:hypothetical protein|nr:hypothetical protein [Mycoplasmatota bacterium]
MAVSTVKVTAKHIKKREKRIKKLIILIIILFLFLLIVFAVLSLFYRGGDFVITLDPNLALKSGLKMFDEEELKHDRLKFYAKGLEFMDNISINWLPKDIDNHKGGSHNGENYIAYTFYLENNGDKPADYWYELVIEDVIKNIDDAIRIMIIQNKERVVYAKINDVTKKEEKDTVAFYSNEQAIIEQRKALKVGDTDKYTIVIWLEGDDPDCLDHLIGGEIKISMRIIESHIDLKGR